MTIAKKIEDAKAKKAELLDNLKAKMAEAEAVASNDAAYEEWSEEVDAIEDEVKSLDAELTALETKLADQISRAKRVEDLVANTPEGNDMFKPAAPLTKKFSHEKGADYAGAVEIRSLMARVQAKQHGVNVEDMAKHMFPNDQRIAAVVRAPLPIPETTTPANIGPELVLQHDAQSEMIELLRNELMYPRMPGMRVLPLPANRGSIRIPVTTGAIAANWVEEGNPIAVSNPSFANITIAPKKLGVITGASRELLQRSDPAYEQLARDMIIRGIAEAVDTTFMSDLAATAGSPAGLFAGLGYVAAAGTLPAAPTAQQIINFINQMKLAAMRNNMGSRNWVWVMPVDTMVGIMSLRNALDGPLFPEVAAGQLQGYPIVSTTNFPLSMPVSGDRIIGLIDASEIFFGLGSGISLATSDVASIQYDTTPANPAINTVSAFQSELIFVRGVLDTAFARRRDQAVLIAPTLL